MKLKFNKYILIPILIITGLIVISFYNFYKPYYKFIDDYNTIKEKHNINQLKVCLSKYTILMRRYDFYKRCLLEIGFEQKDKEIFTLKVE